MQSDDFLPGDAPITRAEAVAMMELPAEMLDRLASGAFAMENDRLTLRQALGINVLIELCMLPVADAVSIASAAAAEAQPGGKRLLAVGWVAGKPCAAWVASVSNDLTRCIVAVPAETMFTTLAARLVAFRAAMQRPN